MAHWMNLQGMGFCEKHLDPTEKKAVAEKPKHANTIHTQFSTLIRMRRDQVIGMRNRHGFVCSVCWKNEQEEIQSVSHSH